MKKTLITLLALVFVLSIAATAMAANNPFVDVPTTSWAYGAISKLAAAGVIDGYGDGTFRGDRSLTRYEAAQMVAKAMAKEDMASAENKAMIDKLAVEFATELNNLGVRVAKLEANASTIKFTGDARLRFSENYVPYTTANGTAPVGNIKGGDLERFRLNMTAVVNDDTTFNGRIGDITTYVGTNPTFYLLDMNFVTKNVFSTGITLTLGRQDVAMGPTGYLLSTTGMVDAVKASVAIDQGSLDVGYGDFTLINGANSMSGVLVAGTGFDKAVWANFKYPLGNAVKFSAGYLQDVAGVGTVGNSNINMKVTDVALTAKLGGDFSLLGEYWVNNGNNSLASRVLSSDPSAFVVRLAYKAVDPKVAGSWGTFVEYYNAQYGSIPSNSVCELQSGQMVNFANDQKAIDLVVQYAIAKNMTIDAIQSFNTAYSTYISTSPIGNYTRVNLNYIF